MAISYIRPNLAMATRRSPRKPQVTFQKVSPKIDKQLLRAKKATTTSTYLLAIPLAEYEKLYPNISPTFYDPVGNPYPPTTTRRRAAGEEEDPEAQLPQTFPHGLHPSSLEPGATDQQYPLTTLFPEPPPVNGESYENETPLQQVVHLRKATQTVTRLIASLSSSLWTKATD